MLISKSALIGGVVIIAISSLLLLICQRKQEKNYFLDIWNGFKKNFEFFGSLIGVSFAGMILLLGLVSAVGVPYWYDLSIKFWCMEMFLLGLIFPLSRLKGAHSLFFGVPQRVLDMCN